MGYYRDEHEAFEKFMFSILGSENFDRWKITQEMQNAVRQVVDTLI